MILEVTILVTYLSPVAKKGGGFNIRKTFLVELSEPKLTIATHWMQSLQNDIESGLLLPTSQIERPDLLKME